MPPEPDARPEREPEIPPPPVEPAALATWAEAHGVGERLDDAIFSRDGRAGTVLPSRTGETFTYRQILIDGRRPGRDLGRYHSYFDDTPETARRYLHLVAKIATARRAERAFLEANGREPEHEVVAELLARLRAALSSLTATRATAPLPLGTYEPVQVRVTRAPVPTLRYEERTLTASRWHGAPRGPEVALCLLGWNESEAPRWQRWRGDLPVAGDVTLDEQQHAIEAMIDFLRDPRAAGDHEILADLLRTPGWQYALDALDEGLAELAPSGARAPADAPAVERIAFRVTAHPGAGRPFEIQPLVQKRGRGGAFSRGANLQWFQFPNRADLTPADRRVYQAYNDPFERDSDTWGGGPLTSSQVFRILRALIDHPAVFLAGQRDGARLEIRQGRLRLRFATAGDGSLAPCFELLGLTLLATEVAGALADARYLTYLHQPMREAAATAEAPQVLLAEVGPQAAALVAALAQAPARFPPEAHDALATRLESLQEAVDIDFPSQWTRTIAAADDRLVARLQLLASGAIELRLAVRPVALGPMFTPGEGPALVLEGQGGTRHGARRDRQRERQAGLALAERLEVVGGGGQAAGADKAGQDDGAGGDASGRSEEIAPWCWRVSEGDPALHVVATLKEMGDEVVVEWADDGRWTPLGAVGRGNMHMKVADRRDWFAVEGGAEVEGEVVPLAQLFAAIRDGRRYVPVGARGFVRIEDSLRAALVRAEAALFETRGAIQMSAVAADPFMGLVEHEAQVEVSRTFSALLRRIRAGAGESPRLEPALASALRPYQTAGVEWMARLAHWGAGAILADEMGLGKTIQTLAMLVHRASTGPALVVAPTSVVANWINEAARFAPTLAVKLYRGPGRAACLAGLGRGDLLVTSYAIATLDAEALGPIRFGTLVLDEAQAVKNATTERAKALRDLQAEWRLGLTGTPIENHLGELWSLLRVLSPGLLGSWEQFRARYSIPIEKFGDGARRKALALLLRPFVLRRTKAEVARELPPRTEVTRTVRLSPEEQALYEQLRRSTVEEFAAVKKDPERDGSNLRFVLLAALTRLRQLCCHPRLVYPQSAVGSSKAAYLLELLGELREGDHKALVFSQFRSFLDLLAPRLRQHGFRVLVLDGTTPAEVREQRIAAFQAGAADVFLISLKAGGFGLNLTAADTVIHLDPWWNPAVEDQATARAHRIGQGRPVTAVRLVARGTIEETVLGLHAEKRALAASVLEGADVAASLGTDELIDLIRGGGDPASNPTGAGGDEGAAAVSGR